MRTESLAAAVAVLVVLLLILLAVWTHDIRARLDNLADERAGHAEADRLLVPTRFVIEEPECVNRLLEIAQVENVRVGRTVRAVNGSRSK